MPKAAKKKDVKRRNNIRPITDGRKLISRPELMVLFGVTIDTVKRMERVGKLDAIKLTGKMGVTYYRMEQINSILEQRPA